MDEGDADVVLTVRPESRSREALTAEIDGQALLHSSRSPSSSESKVDVDDAPTAYLRKYESQPTLMSDANNGRIVSPKSWSEVDRFRTGQHGLKRVRKNSTC